MKNKLYYLFITQKKYFEKLQFIYQFEYVWNDAYGAGYAATISLTPQEVNALKATLAGSHFQLYKFKNH